MTETVKRILSIFANFVTREKLVYGIYYDEKNMYIDFFHSIGQLRLGELKNKKISIQKADGKNKQWSVRICKYMT